jgi:hypothetical protein
MTVNVFDRMRRKFDAQWFRLRCDGIRSTPPIACSASSDVVVVSQLHHPDVTMYLLAAKSLARFLVPRGFRIVDDGLTADDRSLMALHLGQVEFIRRMDVEVGPLPRGGTWERLVMLSQSSEDAYAIQLDADLLTLRAPTEAMRAATAGLTFTLGTATGQRFLSVEEASAFASTRHSTHVQNVAEQALCRLSGHESLRYVRGCSGFTGFAPGQLKLATIFEFSAQMEAAIGRKKWSEWGSEQVTSNFMAANSPGAIVLPVDRYPFWAPDVDIEAAALVHFFGTFRYSQGVYLREALRLCEQLS